MILKDQRNGQGDKEGSSSLDDLELLNNETNGAQTMQKNSQRRARSSIGVNRKPSAKRESSGGPSKTKNRGATLSQVREKNSSSAMAQIHQDTKNNKTDIQFAMEQDMLIEEMTYHQNHQSQPLSVLGPENQLQQQLKPKTGQSQLLAG